MGQDTPIKLTKTQESVMRWLRGGWHAQVANGSAIHINGKRACNLATIEVLVREGLVEMHDQWSYRATEKGKSLSQT
jgi:hypothetical protein